MIDGTCPVDFCSEPPNGSLGFCKRHYFQRAKGHPFTPPRPSSRAARLWGTVQAGEAVACWEWRGARDRYGYGVARDGGRQVKAHRLAWEIANGRTIPTGLMVCHRCDNPPCCNPGHLFLGTNADNMADCQSKGRRAKGERAGRAKLTADEVRRIRQEKATATLVELGVRYGVSRSTIQFIVQRKTWRHIA